ncbi:tripartite tricarboxylate transporter substrate-binding protein [Hansschlegelia zhihuaiae]|uniref:Tripartite tricarboxylate transporter substrate binding protein BugD n=1 Tax=Hansschlegelia zhihuaiae TaxID=405005 RepID=A0A4Q0M9H8_9HYPH|nr:tripartite tricarboxylate transporter substrate-binding protein [Hansschlegelia zhihuaiae]RXF69860.1 tripartite tricarboxylate transporter substrate binding protein BugD [Hansschlegelia zhihuaiae]
MKLVLKSLAVAAGLALAASSAWAQGYPNRVITLIVPYSAGGPSDMIGRSVAESMTKTLGQQVVVENVTGAGGTLGAARVARADPDGYTLLIHHVALPASASLYDNLTYDTATAFQPLGLINTGPMVLAAKKDFPANDAKEIIAKLKADGQKTTVAHAGVGSNAHLCALLLQKAVGQQFTLVGYRGTGPAMTDLIGGQVDVLCDQSTNAVGPVNAKSIKGYAVSSKERLPALKDLPTLDEAGLKGFEFIIWHGLYAPKGTPDDVVKKLNDALLIALKDESIIKRFSDVGTKTFPEAERTPEAHRKRLMSELESWKRVIAESGASAKAQN